MIRKLLAVLWALAVEVPVWRSGNTLRVGEAYRTNRDLSWLGVHECLESDTCAAKLSSPARIQGTDVQLDGMVSSLEIQFNGILTMRDFGQISVGALPS